MFFFVLLLPFLFLGFRQIVETLRHRTRRHRERITSLDGTYAICQAVKYDVRVKIVYYNLECGVRSSLEELPLKKLMDMGTNFYNVSRDQLLSMCGGVSAIPGTNVVGIVCQS